MKDFSVVTTTNLLSAAREVLTRSSFSEVTAYELSGIDSSNQCLFEDPYSLVAISIFETWRDLADHWKNIQASFVELISDHIPRDEGKIWDCYLLLWTPGLVPIRELPTKRRIQYDTGRVRKLVTSGDDIQELADVETALLPLLPIVEHVIESTQAGVLDRIPEFLESNELPKIIIRSVVQAFEKNDSLVESIHKHGDAE